jgi:hypothetical protein
MPPLICSCLQVFTGVYSQLLNSHCLLSLALLCYYICPKGFLCCPLLGSLLHCGSRLSRSELELELVWHASFCSPVGDCWAMFETVPQLFCFCVCACMHVCSPHARKRERERSMLRCLVNRSLQYFCSSKIP